MLLEVTETGLSQVELVAASTVPELWPLMLPILEEKAEEFLKVYSEDEIFRLLCMDQMDLWLGCTNSRLDGFAFCGWEVHSRARYYHVLGIFGDNLRKYLDMGLRKMERYAFEMGATEIIMEGRFGWKRILEVRGWRPRTLRLRKNLRRALGN